MEVSGTIITIGEEVNVTDSFSKRTLLIEQDEKYRPKLQIEFHNDKCTMLDDVTTGNKVKVSINLKSNPGKKQHGELNYFTNVIGWKLLKI